MHTSPDRAVLFAQRADGTLALLVYLAMAIALMVIDRRFAYLGELRSSVQTLVKPVWSFASIPAQAVEQTRLYFTDKQRLAERADALQRDLLLRSQELLALRAQAREYARLRELVGNIDVLELRGQVARVIAVDLDPYSQRIALDRGQAQGVVAGAILLDQFGVVGQVIEPGPSSSVAILISDVNHSIPAEVARNGLRLLVVGTGQADLLRVESVALTGDLRADDLLYSSGLGGVFPPGLPIGRVVRVYRAPGASFARADVQPLARLDTGREVLVLPPRPAVGPPEPGPKLRAQATPNDE